MRRSKPLLGIAVLVVGVTAAVAADVELRLEPATITVAAGERIPARVFLDNHGPESITVVLPGDGSENGWRTPVVGWSVIDARLADKPHPLFPRLVHAPRCGNINPLQPDEVVELAAGEEIELRQWLAAPTMKTPGRYRVFFHYRNVPGMEWRGSPLGEHDPVALQRVTESTEVSLWSNEILVTVD